MLTKRLVGNGYEFGLALLVVSISVATSGAGQISVNGLLQRAVVRI